ncbi:hypothetical protein HPB49_007189 [Dermacentor silvarum]|uniref:Uncharacterized protein n=1 Tax=Dermacentor silvarum TaxID=543639 RepID=A0ACB8DXQ0_DERSI|nr:hypothetical protein HPB49_007189 [Dermacentor silvarum]
MSEKESLRQLRCYFTDQEWAEMPDLTRERYANMKRDYDAMNALDLKPAMPEFMKSKQVAPNRVAKSSAQSRSEKQQPKKPANTAQAPKTGAKGKEKSGEVKLAPRKKTLTAPVKERAFLTDNKQFVAGDTIDHKSADASDAGCKRPSRARKKRNYAECDDRDGESTDKPISSTGSDSPADIRYPRRQQKEVNYMECEEEPDEDYLCRVRKATGDTGAKRGPTRQARAAAEAFVATAAAAATPLRTGYGGRVKSETAEEVPLESVTAESESTIEQQADMYVSKIVPDPATVAYPEQGSVPAASCSDHAYDSCEEPPTPPPHRRHGGRTPRPTPVRRRRRGAVDGDERVVCKPQSGRWSSLLPLGTVVRRPSVKLVQLVAQAIHESPHRMLRVTHVYAALHIINGEQREGQHGHAVHTRVELFELDVNEQLAESAALQEKKPGNEQSSHSRSLSPRRELTPSDASASKSPGDASESSVRHSLYQKWFKKLRPTSGMYGMAWLHRCMSLTAGTTPPRALTDDIANQGPAARQRLTSLPLLCTVSECSNEQTVPTMLSDAEETLTTADKAATIGALSHRDAASIPITEIWSLQRSLLEGGPQLPTKRPRSVRTPLHTLSPSPGRAGQSACLLCPSEMKKLSSGLSEASDLINGPTNVGPRALDSGRNALRNIQELSISQRTYPVSAYLSTPDDSCKGVVPGVEPGTPSHMLVEEMQASGIQILQARMMGQTNNALVTFEGLLSSAATHTVPASQSSKRASNWDTEPTTAPHRTSLFENSAASRIPCQPFNRAWVKKAIEDEQRQLKASANAAPPSAISPASGTSFKKVGRSRSKTPSRSRPKTRANSKSRPFPIPLPVVLRPQPGEASNCPGISGIPVALQEGATKQAGNIGSYPGPSAAPGPREHQCQGGTSGACSPQPSPHKTSPSTPLPNTHTDRFPEIARLRPLRQEIISAIHASEERTRPIRRVSLPFGFHRRTPAGFQVRASPDTPYRHLDHYPTTAECSLSERKVRITDWTWFREHRQNFPEGLGYEHWLESASADLDACTRTLVTTTRTWTITYCSLW